MTAARTAETVAAELHDSTRDLEPHEIEFLAAVHRIGMTCARTKGEAVRDWGDRTRAYDAVAFLANQKRAEHYAKALTKLDIAANAREVEYA